MAHRFGQETIGTLPQIQGQTSWTHSFFGKGAGWEHTQMTPFFFLDGIIDKETKLVVDMVSVPAHVALY